ncbi:hypothetical protein [Pseudomonas putida]|uniref:hypothetical protein n=1 Tax=Pseudomonas putida TaxID=303 RepID=UPI0008192C18|nr:hypothetical protein [Pseudomonas putida]OCT22264.1 hypothetical protein A6E24_15130 [Pseudomonas putida]OCT23808.1 hypothetical protein A6E23_17670 [Pseudomonas putida]OCT24479.1 hypothetical protein A6E20_11210 [Pseudomonas putida]OCT37802.1 hypothetical protein A6E19_16900 [Pseudomonas putida]
MRSFVLSFALLTASLPAFAYLAPRPIEAGGFNSPWIEMLVEHGDPNANVEVHGDTFVVDMQASFNLDDESRGGLFFVARELGSDDFHESFSLGSGARTCSYSIKYTVETSSLQPSARSTGPELASCTHQLTQDGNRNILKFVMD